MAGAQSRRVQESQADGLRQWHRYLLSTYCSDCSGALEVGCGHGFVMRDLSDLFDLKGIDIDDQQVATAVKTGLDVEKANGLSLPFKDGSFDLVYGSFYLMWVEDPLKALMEMVRVSAKKVVLLNEPVWTKTIYEPEGLGRLVRAEIEVILEDGGYPDMGSGMIEMLCETELPYRFGTVPKDTSPRETSAWIDVEAGYLREKDIEIDIPEPIMFNVPFFWTVIDRSGR